MLKKKKIFFSCWNWNFLLNFLILVLMIQYWIKSEFKIFFVSIFFFFFANSYQLTKSLNKRTIFEVGTEKFVEKIEISRELAEKCNQILCNVLQPPVFVGLPEGFAFFLLDAEPLITKPNKLTEYCRHFFLVSLDVMMRGVDFLNDFGLKVILKKIFFFTNYRKVIINKILINHTIGLTPTNTQ